MVDYERKERRNPIETARHLDLILGSRTTHTANAIRQGTIGVVNDTGIITASTSGKKRYASPLFLPAAIQENMHRMEGTRNAVCQFPYFPAGKVKQLLSTWALALFIGCGAHMNYSITDRNERVRQFLDASVNDGDFPGIQYVVVDSSQRIFQYCYGWADIENRILMQPSTTMMAYSMTKTFTAAAVLQLIEAGKIGLDDSVHTYFPSTPYDRSMTIRHLLSQTSGIPNPIPLRWVHLVRQHAAFDESLALEAVLRDNPESRFPPGSKYAYSNISYWILGEIVERTSGQSFPEYMHDHVFLPLHLDTSQASFTIVKNAQHAKGYLKKYSFMNLAKSFLIDAEFIGEYEDNWLHIHDHHLNGPGFGGLIATAQAVATFLQDQLRGESVLFGRKTRELFFSQQKTTTGGPIDMTPGWHIGDLKGVQYLYKEGGGGGYHAEMRIYPARGIASVIMVNESSSTCTDVQSEADKEFVL